LYGSASTWVFNVLRELSIAQYGADRVLAVFSDSVQQILEDPRAPGRHIVWKLHRPDRSWGVFASLSRAKIILTLRDPRDATLSMMQRFGTGFAPALGAVLQATQAVAAAASKGAPGLRYEDRFFDRPATVAKLAQHLGLTVQPADQARIFDTYATEQVRRFGLALDTLPPDRVKSVGTATSYDEVTQIHRRHIGDQRIGKWRDQLDPVQRATANKQFAPFLRAFGYETE